MLSKGAILEKGSELLRTPVWQLWIPILVWLGYRNDFVRSRKSFWKGQPGIAQIQVGNWKVAVEVDPSLHHSFPTI